MTTIDYLEYKRSDLILIFLSENNNNYYNLQPLQKHKLIDSIYINFVQLLTENRTSKIKTFCTKKE